MGIEFRLGRGDHLVVESFLAAAPEGVAAIVVDAPNIDRQEVAIEAARSMGVEVVIETLTDRLAEPGYVADGVSYGMDHVRPRDLQKLGARAQFVERVIAPQLSVATSLVAPHFFIVDVPGIDLNIALARLTVAEYPQPVRAVIAIRRSLLAAHADRIAQELANAGVQRVDLRISPLGGESEGPQKVRSAFSSLLAFRRVRMATTLAYQSIVGHTAFALALADRYSTGIGYRERYDFMAEVARQRRPARVGGRRGPTAGVFLPNASLTVTRSVAASLLRDSSIRSRLACSIGSCADSIDGPTRDPRGHYMHSHAALMHETSSRPAPWRATMERDRLSRALELRELINEHHLPRDVSPMRTRTISTLLMELDAFRQRSGDCIKEIDAYSDC